MNNNNILIARYAHYVLHTQITLAEKDAVEYLRRDNYSLDGVSRAVREMLLFAGALAMADLHDLQNVPDDITNDRMASAILQKCCEIVADRCFCEEVVKK